MSTLTAYALAAALLLSLVTGITGYVIGRKHESQQWESKGYVARVQELERALATEMVADLAADITRAQVRTESSRLHAEITHSIEIVRTRWDRPACVVPDAVRVELQTRIDQANAAASAL